MTRRAVLAACVIWALVTAPEAQVRLRFVRALTVVLPSVALDVCSESHTGTTTSTNEASFSWTHTPAATPRGVVVFVARYGANSAAASAVSYGEASLAAVEGGSAIDTSGEPMRMQTFFLGADVPTGAQTVTVTRSNNADGMYAVTCTVTANGDTSVAGIVLLEGDGALSEQMVDDGLTAGTSLRFAAVQSGENSAANVVGGEHSTSRQSIAPGNRVVRVLTETEGGFGARPVGAVWATEDDRAAVHLAIVSDASDLPNPNPGAGGGSQTVIAAGCEEEDLEAAYAAVASGGIIEVPAGECTWTEQITFTSGKSVRVVGQDAGPTINDSNSDDTRVWRIDCPTNGYLEIANFTFVEALDTDEDNHPLIEINDCEALSVHDLTFTGYSTNERSEIVHIDNSFGVVYNITWSGGATNWMLVGHTQFKGVGQFGDNSWAQDTDWGSPEAIYIEDSTFTNNGNTGFQIIEANGEGARYVARFNSLFHYFIGGHGTESPGRPRGVRKVEAYENAWTVKAGQSLDRAAQIRSGTILFHNNTIARESGGSPSFNQWVRLWQARLTDSLGGWGYCDGTGAFDLNDTTGGPNGDGIYVTGTATSGTTTDTLVDSTKDFTTACDGGSCVGYSLRDLTRNRSSLITGAKGDTITTEASVFDAPHNYQEGDEYEIRRVIRCIDHVASGKGTLLSGNFGSISPNEPPMNEPDPVYVFRNTGGSPVFSVAGNRARLTQNVDYFMGTSSFDGTAGVGSGTRAERPATCTTGVAYWATDGGGNWNTANETENDGGLDKCVDTDTWQNDWYVPYTYPHPFRSQFPPTN